MLRPHAHTRALLLGIVVFLSARLLTAQTPVAAMYADDQVRGKTVALGFFTASIAATSGAAAPAGVYVTLGDLQRVFDDSRFRVDGAIVPTNTELQLTAPAPATQRVLIDRVQKQPALMQALQDQAAARRGRGAALDIGVDTFVATLPSSTGSPGSAMLPSTLCLIATDFAGGGAIDRRELFDQDRMRKGITACLTALDTAGVQSLVVPLVGAASSGTQSADPRYEGQRVLMECRLINAIAGITLGIHDFAPARRNVKEIGIIQWDQEILGMFGASRTEPMSRAAQSAYRTYTNQVKVAVRNGLAGQKTTASDVSGSCGAIFTAP